MPQLKGTGALMGDKKLSQEEYDKLLEPMSAELASMARWVAETEQRIVVIFEGRDTAGKGGSIEMFSRLLNPRQCRVVALPSPDERERSEWYFQRYTYHFPAKGEITLFDRSWYNRAGVERVMGYCTEEQAEAFLRAVPDFEKQLTDDGILLFKYWLCCDQETQEERFLKRLNSPVKRWKLSPVDIQARDRYDEYTQARERMLAATNTPYAPWTLVDFNHQPLGRLTLLRNLLDRIPDVDLPLAKIDWPKLKGKPKKERFGVIEPIPDYKPQKGDK
jgi:polyphosphate kinase 2